MFESHTDGLEDREKGRERNNLAYAWTWQTMFCTSKKVPRPAGQFARVQNGSGEKNGLS